MFLKTFLKIYLIEQAIDVFFDKFYKNIIFLKPIDNDLQIGFKCWILSDTGKLPVPVELVLIHIQITNFTKYYTFKEYNPFGTWLRKFTLEEITDKINIYRKYLSQQK